MTLSVGSKNRRVDKEKNGNGGGASLFVIFIKC